MQVTPTAAWYRWYGARFGLDYAHALDLPHGELLDLIAVDQIKTMGFVPVRSDEDDIWTILAMK